MKSLLKYFILLALLLTVSTYSQKDKPIVTFVELGSVNCIPCKQMQPIMKSIEEKYGSQIKVIFYDVWKEDQKKYAEQYDISLIPTKYFWILKEKNFSDMKDFTLKKRLTNFLRNGLKPLKKKK